MTQHIGIVGCSAEGAALCYRTICSEGSSLLGAHAHPEVSMHTPSFAEYVRYLERGELEGVGDLMLRSAQKLANAGPDNTIHQAFSYVEPRSPLPWIHIAEVVAAEARARKLSPLGADGMGEVYRARNTTTARVSYDGHCGPTGTAARRRCEAATWVSLAL